MGGIKRMLFMNLEEKGNNCNRLGRVEARLRLNVAVHVDVLVTGS